jgi:DNA-binding NarL/FixJ family response regulator
MDKIRVLIADDQTLMRDGLKTILELEDGLEVVGTAADGSEACALCDTLSPDVLLMDIRMPVMNGVEATKLIKEKHPKTTILILTTFDDDEYIVEALNNGAAGYLLKDIEANALIKAIIDVYSGSFILPSHIATKLVKHFAGAEPQRQDTIEPISNELAELSDREIDVAKMLADGFTNKQISSSLYISEGTVKNYVSTIYSKLGIADRTAAALKLKKLLNKN